MNKQDVSLSRLIGHHWRLIACVVAGFVGLAGLVTMLLPRKYESSTSFLVNTERADLVLSPEKTPAAPPNPDITAEQVNSELSLLQSRDILEQTVRDEKLYLAYEKPPQPEPSLLSIQKAVNRLGKDLDAKNITKTNIIQVSYRNRDPFVAAAVLRKLSEHYLKAHLTAHGASGSLPFFSDEVEQYRKRLFAARAALGAFHQNKQLFSLNMQEQATVDRLSEVEGNLSTTDADVADEEQRLQELRRELSGTPERSVTQVRKIPNQSSVQQLEGTLADLRNKRVDLTAKFKSNDRFVTSIDKQISQTEAQLASELNSSAVEQTTDIDAVHQALLSEFKKSLAEVQGLRARKSKLATERNMYLSQLSSMDRDDISLQELEQQERDAQESYDVYMRRLVESRLADSLDRQKFSNVAVIETPQPSLIPAFPNLLLNLAVGMMMGLFAGLGIAYFREVRQSFALDPDERGGLEPLSSTRQFNAASGD